MSRPIKALVRREDQIRGKPIGRGRGRTRKTIDKTT